MSKAFLISMVILTFAAFGVAIYVVNQSSISVDEEAQKISPATLNRSIPDKTETRKNDTVPSMPGAEKLTGQAGTCLSMNYDEAAAIATTGGCGENVKLKDTHFCNEETKTWWIDMDSEKPGCNPACVVNVETKAAEINWRCTGAIMPEAGTIPAESEALQETR